MRRALSMAFLMLLAACSTTAVDCAEGLQPINQPSVKPVPVTPAIQARPLGRADPDGVR